MASGGGEVEEDEAEEVWSKKAADMNRKQDPARVPLNRHRLHRSPVHPFFCCGSQVSLNSITELKDVPPLQERVENEYVDLSDSDDLTKDITLMKLGPMENKPFRSALRTSSKRKKPGDKSSARKKAWALKLRGKLAVPKKSRFFQESELSHSPVKEDMCVCTSYKRASCDDTSDNDSDGSVKHEVDIPFSLVAHLVPPASGKGPIFADPSPDRRTRREAATRPLPFIPNFNDLYPSEDVDALLIAQRKQEMEEGLDVQQVWVHKNQLPNNTDSDTSASTSDGRPSHYNLCSGLPDRPVGQYPSFGAVGLLPMPSFLPGGSSRSSLDGAAALAVPVEHLSCLLQQQQQQQKHIPPQGVHTQVDYIHYLVPDLQKIVNAGFYWGVMDRYEAEKLIENKPEGTFLLRDSAQDEFLFSVSFRRYGRSLHARIEQWNHSFSFDSRDPGVFATDSVCGLIEHYKDPSCCMFFEPLLTAPLNRTFPFSLQHLARAVICNHIQYDSINKLILPRSLKENLRYYHYKQKIRVRRFDNTP